MISSVPLAWTLTTLFVLTGCYALTRWSTAVSARWPAARRTAELAHVVMSAAMVVMTWTWYGSTGLWVQVALFTVFGAFFGVAAVRGIHCGSPGRVAGAAHALMAVAMVWMLAAMPVIMPLAVPASGGGGHGRHAGHGGAHSASGAGDAMHAGQAAWAVAVTVALCVALLVAAGFWAVRSVGGGAAGGGSAAGGDNTLGGGTDRDGGTTGSDRPAAGTGLGGAPGGGTAVGTAVGTATAVADEPAPAPAAPRPRSARLGARQDAVCHAAMSLGMVLMLAAMVTGW